MARRPVDIRSTFHEPLVMFGYLAAVTTTLELVTGVIVPPQRQAALVAKQAAEVDLLSNGRLRFGVGLGWNAVEYEALGANMKTRGKRSEEQVEVLRRLWTEDSVTFEGRYHRLTGVGLAPMPVQRPIPVWFAAASDPGYERAGRLGDGWFPMVEPGPDLDYARAPVDKAVIAAGRDPAAMGMEAQITWTGDPDAVVSALHGWAEAGATHVSINTMGAGFGSVDQHLAVLETVAAGIE
jgi:probable F420-dependent oxidoreductase